MTSRHLSPLLADPIKNPAFSPNKIELITFDFDGTLARLTIDFDLMRRQTAQLAADFGLDWASAQGDYVLEMITDLAGKNGPAGRQFAELAGRAIEELEVAAAAEGELFPDVRAQLAALAGQGLNLAVITRNCRRAVEAVFPDVEDWCDLFLPRDAVPRPKPDPAHMELVLDRLGVTASRCLVIGDHPTDVATARSVGAWAGGVTTGRIAADGFEGADLVMTSLGELVGLFAAGAG